eukprot:7749600-Pyramimonas_sp.AAC.2
MLPSDESFAASDLVVVAALLPSAPQAEEDITSRFFEEAEAAAFVNEDFEIEVNTTLLAERMPAVQEELEAEVEADVNAIIGQINQSGSAEINNQSTTASLMGQIMGIVAEQEATVRMIIRPENGEPFRRAVSPSRFEK